ncbi:MAG TPA: LiaF-related protein [Chitinophagaceae bacterium]|nr:hypothetical protein [Chitinophagaceae bacterium]MCB9054468.1 hypothetical protein [Chitinophagales bacterium]HPG10684.1 LiaF-related protein [Chitinophagaceae bacterium]HRX93176.1 LiaF-related protein [Chitinophagaceae bacterium]
MREDFEKRWENRKMRWEARCEARGSGKGHIWTGAFILLIGIAALIKASVTDLPDWVFSWQTLLITLGVFIGFRHGFRGASWLILILIGSIFLIDDIIPDFSYHRYMWPMALIVIGLFFILRPRNRYIPSSAGEKKNDLSDGPSGHKSGDFTKEDFIDSTCIFSGSKKNIISKNFKGGDIVTIMGGTELDLTQADVTEPAILEITTIFGGTKLLIPSNWEIKSEAVMIFGGIEDKRKMQPMTEAPEKVVILKGTVIFGGIEIKSY